MKMQKIIKPRSPSRQLLETVNFAFMKIFDSLAKMLVPYCKMKSQQIQHFNMVHPRDISLAESRGSSRFLST